MSEEGREMPKDDPVLAALSRIETTLIQQGQALTRLEMEQERLRTQLNDKMDNILDRLSAVRQDVDTARGQMIFVLQDSLSLSQRITKIENEIRRPQ